jgi:D-beta-D-heptose 7-phosphate kinase/D-beta-D-heptose 1-phosphate adenosyltransferase
LRKDRLIDILNAMPGKRVLVLGDVMLDEYVWGNVKRISPEAPVIVVEVERDSYTPGGAANVVNNLQALGGVSSMIGVVGDDDAGRSLMSCLEQNGVDVSGIVTDASRPTTKKTRIIAHSQQIVRVDRESRKSLSRRALAQVIARLAEQMASIDIVVFSDYDKGMAGRKVTQAVLDLAKQHGKLVLVNPKPSNVRQFKCAAVMSLNQSEIEAATGIAVSDDKSLQRAARRLLNSVQPETLIVTRGPLGMSLFGINGEMETVPAHPVEVYDVAGAGDTVVSVLALALAAGATIGEAAVLANCAGGAVVRKVGVATVTRNEIAALLNGD